MKQFSISIALFSLLAVSGITGSVANAAPASVQAADNITVRGTLVDENGEPVMAAAVVLKGNTSIGAASDLDGNFTLSVPADAVLIIQSLGYETKEVAVNGKANLGTITVNTESLFLDQVVVIGYGTQKKADLTGSVAVVEADELKRVSHSNISSMLEGKVAGVNITTDGQPGADPSVRIRGLGSFGDTSPLYVIDGVPMGTSIRDFSPNDIETIQVLKDASAAAIYGSRAANGVVIITTKSGKKEQPMKFDYSGYFGVDRIRKGVYDVMDSEEYGKYVRMAFANSGMEVPSGYNTSSPDYLDPSKYNTDWFDTMFKTGIRQNHNVNISGGGQNNTYNIGLDYFSQKGTLEGAGPDFDRFTARINNNMDVKFLSLKTGIVYSHSKQNNMSMSNANEYVQGLYGQQYPVMASALIMPPTILARDSRTWVLDDILAPATEYNYDSFGYGTYYDKTHGDLRMTNPLLTNNLLERNTLVDRIVATGTAKVDLLDMIGHKNENHKLSYNLNLSYSRTIAKDFTFVPAFIQSTTNYLDKSNETLNEGYRSYTDALIENFLTYEGTMGRHHLNLVAGQTFERETYHTLTGRGNNMPEPYYLQVSNAETRDAGSYESEHVLASFLGRFTYDYDGKYLLQATVRRDGSSRLSSDDHWDWFPSFSAGWRIDRENFFNVDFINMFKIRTSYGILGNENIGEYQYMGTMPRGNYTYSFGGTKVTGSAISDYVNTAIRWEKKKTFDIGVDLAFWENKFEINADWYHAMSEDLLYAVAVPAEAGSTNTTVTMNAATMLNTGFELAATYRSYENALKYEISANMTLPKNEVKSLGMTNEPRTDGYSRTEVGNEVGRFYGYVYEGIFQSQEEIDNRVNDLGNPVVQSGAKPGDVAYKDVNNDGKITNEDQDYLGSGMAKIQFGLNLRFEYKNFDLNISTYGAAGYKVLDYVDMVLHNSYGITNKSTDLLNAWTVENPSETVPAVAYKTDASITNDMFSSRFLQNGAYWKIANVELGYNFKDGTFGKHISNARAYVSAQNLASLTKYKGYNVDFAGGTFTPGFNYCSYPTPMSFMAGVRFSF